MLAPTAAPPRPCATARLRRALLVVAGALAASACNDPAGPRERTDRIVFVPAMTSLSSNNDIWRMKPDGSALENLTRYPADYSDLQSTGDGTIVFAAGRSFGTSTDCGRRIWRMASDGSQLRPVTSGPDCSFHPRVSPGGAHVAYVRGNDIFVSSLDGSAEARLTGALPPVPASPCGATPKVTVMITGWYAPDRVSFWRHICQVGQTNYTVRMDGTDLREVPATEPAFVYVSPDLARVSFTHDGQLWVRNVDGSGLRSLAPVATYSGVGASPWSPDGSRLVFTDAAGKFASVGIDGGGLQPLPTPERTMFAGWSRDGAQLLWKIYGTATIDLYVSGTDGSGFVALPTGGTLNQHVTWVDTP